MFHATCSIYRYAPILASRCTVYFLVRFNHFNNSWSESCIMACFHACTAGAQPATVWDLWIVPWLLMANNTYNQSTIVHANSHYLTEQKKKKCINYLNILSSFRIQGVFLLHTCSTHVLSIINIPHVQPSEKKTSFWRKKETECMYIWLYQASTTSYHVTEMQTAR